MKILDSMYEEALEIILENYDGNNQRYIELQYDTFPQYMQLSFKKIFGTLEYNGYLANHVSTLANVSFTLTREGINYFETKKNIWMNNQPKNQSPIKHSTSVL